MVLKQQQKHQLCTMKTNLKQTAQTLYLEGMAQKEIAQKLHLSEQTISKWKIAGQWDQLKESIAVSRDEIVKKLYQQLNTLLSDHPVNADHVSKINKAIREIKNQLNVSDYITCFMHFNQYLSSSGMLKEAQLLNSLQQQFIQTIIKK